MLPTTVTPAGTSRSRKLTAWQKWTRKHPKLAKAFTIVLWVLGALITLPLLLLLIMFIGGLVVRGFNAVMPATSPVVATAQTVEIDHGTWSLYGDPSFTVTAGSITESGSDLFTDPSKGGIIVTINPAGPVCLLQYGTTMVYDNQFTAAFSSGDTGAGFRVISQDYWETLPASDGAYNLCWPRH